MAVPQLDDDVRLELRLPPETEEWAEDVLESAADGMGMRIEMERTPEALVVAVTIGGNCNALMNAESFLRDVNEALQEGEIDVMDFTLTAMSQSA